MPQPPAFTALTSSALTKGCCTWSSSTHPGRNFWTSFSWTSLSSIHLNKYLNILDILQRNPKHFSHFFGHHRRTRQQNPSPLTPQMPRQRPRPKRPLRRPPTGHQRSQDLRADQLAPTRLSTKAGVHRGEGPDPGSYRWERLVYPGVGGRNGWPGRSKSF